MEVVYLDLGFNSTIEFSKILGPLTPEVTLPLSFYNLLTLKPFDNVLVQRSFSSNELKFWRHMTKQLFYERSLVKLKNVFLHSADEITKNKKKVTTFEN